MGMKLSDKEQKIFLQFLKYLAVEKVSSIDGYKKALEDFKEVSRRNNNPVNIEGIILEASEFLADSMPSFKATQWPEFKEKKGFNILYNYGPEKVRKILKSGDGKEYVEELYAISSLLEKNGIKVLNNQISRANLDSAKKVVADYLNDRVKEGFKYKGWEYKLEEDYEPEEATKRYHMAIKDGKEVMLDFTSFEMPSVESFKLLVDNNFPKRPTNMSAWNNEKVKKYLGR